MKIFKFGGASVKDAAAVKNVAKIVQSFPGEQLVVVVSAMGKITNALERLADAYFYKNADAVAVLNEIKEYHRNLLDELFGTDHPIQDEISNTFVELDWIIEDEPTGSYNFEYDQIVSMGELVSTKIISAYLTESGIKNTWWDVRGLIQTDNTYREGKLNWELTGQLVKEQLLPFFGDFLGRALS